MDVRILGIVTCLLLLVSACGGTSESREMTTTVAPTTTEASIIESTDLEELTERLENLAKENPTATAAPTTAVSESISERNARESASDYLRYSAFSRSG